jgi:hypothetical protein
MPELSDVLEALGPAPLNNIGVVALLKHAAQLSLKSSPLSHGSFQRHIAHSRITVACATNFTITSLPNLSGPLPQHSRFT